LATTLTERNDTEEEFREVFPGFEHLVRDRHGRFYWKGNLVECTSIDDPARLQEFVENTARMCEEIEAQGKEVNFTNVVIYLKEKYQHLNVGYDVTRIKNPVKNSADSESFVTGIRPGI